MNVSSSLFSYFIVFIVFLSSCSCSLENHRERLFFKDEDSKVGEGAGEGERVVEIALGEDAVLECEAAGSPGPMLHWIRNGQRITQGSSNAVEEEASSSEHTVNNEQLPVLMLSSTRSRLTLDCARATDAGSYTCVAETPTKRIATKFIVRVVTKKVYRLHKTHKNQHDKGSKTHVGENCSKKESNSAVKIYMWTVHRVEVEGADVQLYCRTTGSSTTTKVTWFDRNGQLISGADPQYQMLDSGDLLIKGIKWNENMGVYRCVVENLFGSDEVETFLYPTKQE